MPRIMKDGEWDFTLLMREKALQSIMIPRGSNCKTSLFFYIIILLEFFVTHAREVWTWSKMVILDQILHLHRMFLYLGEWYPNGFLRKFEGFEAR